MEIPKNQSLTTHGLMLTRLMSTTNNGPFMTYSHPLDLSFRGLRDYLHGDDIYEGMLKAVQDERPAGPLQIQYHSLLRQQPDLICSKEPLTHLRKDPAYRGEARFGTGDDSLYGALMESDRPITSRFECNEPEVVKTAIVDIATRSATLPFPNVGLTIEMAIFLNKKLHFTLLPEIKRWLFVKLELNEALPATGQSEMTLIQKQNLGNRFTRSEILIDGKSFGYISFSTVK